MPLATAAAQTLKVSRDLSLPLDLVTEATAIVATRGAGKSSASAVIVEEAFALGVQAVIFDRTGVYWGLRSNAKGDGPGLPIYVLGGPHGDAPLEPHAGSLIADLVVDTGHSLVLDLSDMSKGGAVKFAAEFLERLYDRKARARSTTLLVIDEAHFYAPQTPRGGFKGDAAKLMGAMEDAVGLGRSRGLGVVLTTQRTQALNKAVLDLIETLLVMRMLSPRARQAVRGWIMEKHEEDDQGVIATLDSLPTGTAWVWSPLRGVLEKAALRRIRTFDSYATPKPGEARVEPTAKKELDLAALGEQIAATAERAKENDPAELRKRIRELERVLAERPAESEPVEVEVPVEVPVLTDADREKIRQVVRYFEESRGVVLAAVESVAGHFARAAEALAPVAEAVSLVEKRGGHQPVAQGPPPTAAPPKPADAARSAVPPAHRPPPTPLKPAVPTYVEQDGVVLNRKAERAVLAVLAQFPDGRTQAQIAIQAGYSKTGGGFTQAVAKLRRAGYVEGRDHLTITQAGLDAIEGQWEPLPQGPALVQWWAAQMKRRAEREVLLYLHGQEGRTIHAADIAAATGYEPTGGGFTQAVAKLRRLGLIEGDRGELRIAGELLA